MTIPWEFTPLEGERIRLDLVGPDDLVALHAIQGDPAVVRFMRYQARTRDEVAAAIERDAAHDRLAATGDYIQPAIRDADGLLVGTLYFRLASLEHRTGEIGWLLSPAERGKGYATEAAALVLDLAFGELGLHRVYAELDPRNDASIAVCLRLGMRHEAHFREDQWLKGEWVDSGVYALLEREHRRARGMR